MIRNSFSLPLRLLQDVAPTRRQLSSLKFPTPNASSTWRQQQVQQRVQLGPDQQTRSFSSTQGLEIKRRGIPPRPVPRPKKKKRYPTPTAKRVAEARTRKNIARQIVIKEERAIAFGDTVWGAKEPTEFVKSFESAPDELPTVNEDNSGATSLKPGTPSTFSTIVAAAREAAAYGKKAPLLNDFIRADELQANLELSRRLTEPVEEQRTGANDPTANAARRERHEREHQIASEAVSRILAVSQAKSKGRKHVNIQRCIEKLGRHNTDGVLLGLVPEDTRDHDVKRIGPDTGSSEVQIALLTLKIRKLAHEREGPLRRDKINKRNLRVLLHRRQKMMRYFWKKNRGGPRWQNLIDTLGLTDANWKGEIILP